MADTSSAGPARDVDPVAMGRVRDAGLAVTMAQLAAPNPHGTDMDLPAALTDDGGM
jgi:hypothetical protein